jgi:GTPase
LVVLNKADVADKAIIGKAVEFFSTKNYCQQVVVVSALKKTGLKDLLNVILSLLPEGEPFYGDDNLSDLPMKFFVGEMIREKIFYLYQDEIPYHATVLVQEYKEKTTLTKISADIILQRETQKGIVLGEGGKMIKQLGTLARKDIEEFIGRKVFLELFVKVRPKWRDNEIQLREYGY